MKSFIKHTKDFIVVFSITIAIYLVVMLFLGRTFNTRFYWEVLQMGLLSAAISWINGIIANNVNISWTEQTIKRLIVSVVLTIVGTIVVSGFVIHLISLLQYGSIGSIPTSFYPIVLVITFFISFFLHGRGFLLEYKESIEEKEALKRINLSSRIESLQNQINPHFLFNSLNVLTNLVHKDADLSVQFIRQMAQVYRYVLQNQEEELVPFSEEEDMLKAYLFLLNIRFGNSIQFEIDIKAKAADLIPPLSLQMLVENAVKHNIASRKRPLLIKIAKEEGAVVVWNNLQLKEQSHDSLGVGLKNIKERYQLLGDKEVLIEKTDDYFKVTLPLLKFS